MEKLGFLRTICAISTIVFISCTGSGTTTKENISSTPRYQIVGEAGDQQVTYKELVENFGSGNTSSDYTLTELKDFLPIYLDYKAKLLSAKDIGYFEDERILSEYETYSKQAAYSYWMENTIRPTLFNEFKYKQKYELKSSHVLIALGADAAPADTQKVYETLLEARSKFLEGIPMSKLDTLYSSKSQGRLMGGDLPWFSVGTTVKPFEDVLYSLEVGEISMPFRTQFGYHIVLLEAMREKIPARNVSHIFIPAGKSSAPLDSAYNNLENGADWNEVVKKYTQDIPSSTTGGKIGWISYGSNYRADFIDSVMTIDPSLPYSKPLKTSYGYQIIKIDSVRTFASEKAEDDYLMQQLENSRNFRKSNSFVVNWLKGKYGSTEEEYVLKQTSAFFKSIDSTKAAEVQLPSELASKTIYSFDGTKYTTQDFLDYLISANKGPFISSYVRAWYVSFQEYVVDSNLTKLTIRELPEFIGQTENYKSGLVVYQINEDSVWSSATVDSTKLEALYDKNPEDYSYGKRYYYHLITSSRDSSIQKAIKYVMNGNSPDSIRANGIAVGVVTDSTGSFQGEPFDKLSNIQPHTFSDVFDYNSRKGVFYLNAILPARKMTFEEAFNKLLADYQPAREADWLSNLRKKYDVKAYPDNLEKSFQEEKKSP